MEQDPVQCLEQEGRFQMLDFQPFLSLEKKRGGMSYHSGEYTDSHRADESGFSCITGATKIYLCP